TLKEERLHHLLIENNHRFDERSPLGEQVQAKIDSLLELRPATAPSKSEEDFVRIRANAEQKVITWKKQRNRRFGEGLTKAHATVPAPRNIQRPSDALWELSVNEMSPERRSQLLEYLAKYTTYLEKETQLRQTAFDRKLTQWDEEELAKLLGSDFNSLVMNSASDSNFAPGENIYSEERVRYRQGVMSSLEGELYTIGQIMEDRFIPPFTEQSASQETLKRIVDQRTVIKLQIEELGSELKSILKSLEDFKGKRKELVKKIEPLMNRGSSQRLSEVIEEGEVLLGVAEKAFENFRNDIIEAIVGLEESGSLTKDNLLAKIAEFSDKEQDFARDKQSFRDQLDLISSVRLEEAALGQLVSELDTSGTRLQAFLQKLIGNYTRSESGITPSESSIEGRIQEAQSARDRILDMLDLKKREWHELGIEIANSAPLGPDQSGNKFVNYYKVSIPWLLNRPLEDLLTMLHEGEMASVYMEALRATLINWESSEMWRSVLQQQDDPNH
ncbi:MAG: hypothetical protein KDD35_10890, partial [Bdellovibrionales bacterium]|nr:hypothetical protein [Bdellovibrionales bacterium]